MHARTRPPSLLDARVYRMHAVAPNARSARATSDVWRRAFSHSWSLYRHAATVRRAGMRRALTLPVRALHWLRRSRRLKPSRSSSSSAMVRRSTYLWTSPPAPLRSAERARHDTRLRCNTCCRLTPEEFFRKIVKLLKRDFTTCESCLSSVATLYCRQVSTPAAALECLVCLECACTSVVRARACGCVGASVRACARARV